MEAAATVEDVAGVARDDVEVKLGNRLAGGRAVVDAEVEGVGPPQVAFGCSGWA